MARSGIELLDENAHLPHTAAITLDLTARHWLTVEPPGLRDPQQALAYARQAVERTAAQMPPYLETLAFAQDAAGLHDKAEQSAMQAIRAYRKVFEILRPVFESPRYPEADRLFRELQERLERATRD